MLKRFTLAVGLLTLTAVAFAQNEVPLLLGLRAGWVPTII